MKKLNILIAASLMFSCAHQESYRLENLKVKTFHYNPEYSDGLLSFSAVYGITDPDIVSIEDVVNSFTVTDWDDRRDTKDHVWLKKEIESNDLSDAHIEGAARFFTSREFNRYRYPDRKMLSDDLKKRIREHIKRQNDDFKTSRIESYLPK